ncbi:hypothetical protein PC116_g583 [Phytophthora cactorum]|nr:hypothetical protein PC116_g583 [Phytophthora cactorum]
MVTAASTPFQKRPRLTKLHELLICNRSHDLRGVTYDKLAA